MAVKHIYEGGLTGFQDDLWIDDRRLIDLLDRDLNPKRSVYGQVRLTVEWLEEAGEREADDET